MTQETVKTHLRARGDFNSAKSYAKIIRYLPHVKAR